MPAIFDKEDIFRYLSGKCNEEESQIIQQWLSSFENKVQAKAFLAEYWDNYSFDNKSCQSNLPALFNSIEQRVGFTTAKKTTASIFTLRSVAVAITTIACCVTVFFLINNFFLTPGNIFIKTAYGETKKINLPDGSVATLNSNSTISYAANWDINNDRQIFLEGEAFFSIKHLAGNQKFKVITNSKFNVEVLGTQFSVYTRNDDAHVVLNSGKVKLDFKNAATQDIIMNPGELVEIAGKTTAVVKKFVDTLQYTSWKDGQIIFNETSMSELAKIIKENYGMELLINDTGLKNMKINGTLPANNKDILLNALEIALQVKVQVEGNYIKINSLK
jgi:transmembrane sensor